MKLKNTSPLGALEIPALGRVVPAGETFEVPDELAAAFAEQAENFVPVVEPKPPAKPKAAKPTAPPIDPEVIA